MPNYCEQLAYHCYRYWREKVTQFYWTTITVTDVKKLGSFNRTTITVPDVKTFSFIGLPLLELQLLLWYFYNFQCMRIWLGRITIIMQLYSKRLFLHLFIVVPFSCPPMRIVTCKIWSSAPYGGVKLQQLLPSKDFFFFVGGGSTHCNHFVLKIVPF